jgi:hypothetical protein
MHDCAHPEDVAISPRRKIGTRGSNVFLGQSNPLRRLTAHPFPLADLWAPFFDRICCGLCYSGMCE